MTTSKVVKFYCLFTVMLLITSCLYKVGGLMGKLPRRYLRKALLTTVSFQLMHIVPTIQATEWTIIITAET